VRRTGVSVLGFCRDLRGAIRKCCEGGRRFASEHHLPARDVGAAKKAISFRRARISKKLCGLREKSGGTQLPGWVLLAQGEIDAAIAHFQSAVKLNPDFALAHLNFSNALVRKGDVAAALREAKEAVRLAPEDSETHHILARTLVFSGDLDGAVSDSGARSNWSHKGRNCTTNSVLCWCRSLRPKALVRSLPWRSDCNRIMLQRIFILVFCDIRKNPSKKLNSIFNLQSN